MTTFSPVTEQEMSDFLSRASATVREYANLSTTLDQLRAEMEHLRTGLADTRAENDKLRDDVKASTDLASQAETERDEVRRKLQDEQGRSAHLTDLITARDSRVTELQKSLDDATKTNTSLDRECVNLTGRVGSLEDMLKHTADRRDYWSREADTNGIRADKAEAELAKLEKMLADIGFHRPQIVASKEPPRIFAEEVKTEAPVNPSASVSQSSQSFENVHVDTGTVSAPEMKPVIHDEGYQEEVHDYNQRPI